MNGNVEFAISAKAPASRLCTCLPPAIFSGPSNLVGRATGGAVQADYSRLASASNCCLRGSASIAFIVRYSSSLSPPWECISRKFERCSFALMVLAVTSLRIFPMRKAATATSAASPARPSATRRSFAQNLAHDRAGRAADSPLAAPPVIARKTQPLRRFLLLPCRQTASRIDRRETGARGAAPAWRQNEARGRIIRPRGELPLPAWHPPPAMGQRQPGRGPGQMPPAAAAGEPGGYLWAMLSMAKSAVESWS